MLKFGSNNIGKVLFGSNVIGKAYYGSNLVYSAGSEPGPGPEPQPYDDWTDGYKLNNGGVVEADSSACLSPFFAIPSGSVYLTYDLLSTNNICFMGIYDANKNYLDYWRQTSRYRTVKVSSISGAAYLRFSMLLADRGSEFVRVRDNAYVQQNLWAGPDYHTEYDNVIFGAYRTHNTNVPTESLANATTTLFDIAANTTSVSFGAGGASGTVEYDLTIFDNNGGYVGYWTQSANPRTINDNRWATTWPKVTKNFVATQADSVFIKNETTNTYLFKGKNIV